jgi:hypothetical protein
MSSRVTAGEQRKMNPMDTKRLAASERLERIQTFTLTGNHLNEPTGERHDINQSIV